MERSFTQARARDGSNRVEPARETIVELRSRRGWTQERLAEKAILSVRTIQNLERGKPIHLGTVAKVAEALGVPTTDCISRVSHSKRHGPSHLAETDADITTCPYRGLLAFREEDAGFYFGRESVLEVLNEKLARKNIIQVSGCSGSGKSSLVSAGLIPALRRSGPWEVLYCRPGSDPFSALAQTLLPVLERGTDVISSAAKLPSLLEALDKGHQLPYLLSQIQKTSRTDGLLLFVDQFEELYTHCSSQSTRDHFMDSLSSLGGTAKPVKLVYTIRADFSHRLLSHRTFLDETQDAEVKLGPMNRVELEAAIRKPSALLDVQFEDGLAERILDDAGAEAGALPLLEFALSELWSRQVNRTLTHSAYERIGQLSGAIAHRAEKVYRSLSGPQQDVARQVLTRLVRLADEGGEDTRQRIPLSSVLSDELINGESGRRVLALLAEARLVTIGVEGKGSAEMVEIAHEALVRRWPRLTQWLQDDREILVWRQRLRLIIHEWEKTGRDAGFLLRGPLLDEARLWLSRRANDLAPLEKDFVSCSLGLWHREHTTRPISELEVLVDSPGRDGGDEGQADAESPDLYRHKGTLLVQVKVFPVPTKQKQAFQARVPELPFKSVSELLSVRDGGRSAESCFDDPTVGPQGLDDQTFSLIRDLQLRGSSGLALELLSPQLDSIADPHVRLKFASIVFDMMHVRGRYADAAELIKQELALHAQDSNEPSSHLAPLKIRLIHHQMFYRPVPELWVSMIRLLECTKHLKEPDCYGESLFMLGGNLGTLMGQYNKARKYLVSALRHAKESDNQYLLARCLRKYGDILRYQGHLQASKGALMEALRLSARGRGTRQRIYALGCLGDLERQRNNYSSSAEYFERAVELARSTFMPGWLGNLYLGLTELALERSNFDDATSLLGQAEAHYRNTHPRHWWGDIQIHFARARLLRARNKDGWKEQVRSGEVEALTAGYSRDAKFASSLLDRDGRGSNILMFL